MPIVNEIIVTILQLIELLLWFYNWVLIVSAILSWLVALDVANPYNRFVRAVGEFCHRLTDPLLNPIRRHMPLVNGIDLSFLALIVIIWLLRRFVAIAIEHLVI